MIIPPTLPESAEALDAAIEPFLAALAYDFIVES